MTSDFFLEEADEWRDEAWDIIRARSDVIFFIITKRPQRIPECLPEDWGDGWENVFINVTAENQRRAEERVPLLLELPFKHRGVNVAPFIDRAARPENTYSSWRSPRLPCGSRATGSIYCAEHITSSHL